MFIVALYLPWCRYLVAQVGVQPQLYADNLKCTSRDPELLLRAARFTTQYVRLVGQEPAPSKCVLLSTSRDVRKEMRDWVLSQEGDQWSVKFDVRDLGGHLDTTFRGCLRPWLAGFVWSFLVSFLSLLSLLIFMGVFGLFVLCFFLLPCMVLRLLCWHLLVFGDFVLLCARWFGLGVNLWLTLEQSLAFLMVLLVVILPFASSGFVFACLGGILLSGPAEVGRVYRLLDLVSDGCPGHGPIHLLSCSAADIGFPLGFFFSCLDQARFAYAG